MWAGRHSKAEEDACTARMCQALSTAAHTRQALTVAEGRLHDLQRRLASLERVHLECSPGRSKARPSAACVWLHLQAHASGGGRALSGLILNPKA